METMLQKSASQKQFESGRNIAVVLGASVYLGVVLAATVLFISFVLTAFPEDAFLTRAIMTIAGLLVGGSMIAFPIALHMWAISGMHRKITIGLYYTEMAIIALNTIVSFSVLQSKMSGAALPAWIVWYEPVSIFSIVYTIFAWGTIFLTDPLSQAKQQELEAEQKFRKEIAAQRLAFLNSIEGEQAILAVATKDIQESFNPERFHQQKQHFGAARAEVPANQKTQL